MRGPSIASVVCPPQRLSRRELLAAADVVVHPSKGEGITLVVSESMASGTPVIISTESLYEVPPEERGLFFAVSLEADSIEAAVLRLTSMNFMEREALRTGCRKFAESRWSWKSVADQYLNLLKQLSG